MSLQSEHADLGLLLNAVTSKLGGPPFMSLFYRRHGQPEDVPHRVAAGWLPTCTRSALSSYAGHSCASRVLRCWLPANGFDGRLDATMKW